MTEETALEATETPVLEQSPSDAAPAVTEADDAQMDAALLEIEKEQGIEDEDEGAAPEPAERAQSALEEETEETEEREETTERELVTDEMEKAISALRRDGLPKSVIEQMTDEQVIETGLKRAKVQSDTDDAFRQLSELKNQTPVEEESGEESSSNAAPVDHPDSVDLDEAMTGFTEIFGEDAGGALKAPLKAAMTPLHNRLEESGQQMQMMARQMEELLIRDARRELSSKFPALEEQGKFESVRERMATLVKSGEYQDIPSLMSDASRIVFSDESADAVKASRNVRDAHRANGQPTPASSRIPAQALSFEEKEDAVLTALEAGESVSNAKRLAGF